MCIRDSSLSLSLQVTFKSHMNEGFVASFWEDERELHPCLCSYALGQCNSTVVIIVRWSGVHKINQMLLLFFFGGVVVGVFLFLSFLLLLLLLLFLFCCSLQKLKSHLVRTQSLNVLPLKLSVGQYIAIHATLTARNSCLLNSPAFFPKPLPIFSCVGCG